MENRDSEGAPSQRSPPPSTSGCSSNMGPCSAKRFRRRGPYRRHRHDDLDDGVSVISEAQEDVSVSQEMLMEV